MTSEAEVPVPLKRRTVDVVFVALLAAVASAVVGAGVETPDHFGEPHPVKPRKETNAQIAISRSCGFVLKLRRPPQDHKGPLGMEPLHGKPSNFGFETKNVALELAVILWILRRKERAR